MNIQQVIIEGLRQQLYHHQFIVLPDFGGFVLKARPAHFSATGLLLHPPAKTVTFNAQLKQNDGILSAWLQKKQGLSPAESINHLVDFASYCRSVLESRRRLTLPGIGFFHLDLENNLGFEPQPDQNFLSSSFGLSPIALPADLQHQKSTARKAVFEDRRIVIPHKKQSVAARLQGATKPLLLVGVILTLLLLLVSISTFKGELRAALSGHSSKKLYNAIAYEELRTQQVENGLDVSVTGNSGVSYLKLGKGMLPVKHVSEGKYHIVLGCFSKTTNATKLLRQLKKRQVVARISDRSYKGMTVVSVGDYPDKQSALNDLAAMQSVVPNAWIKDN